MLAGSDLGCVARGVDVVTVRAPTPDHRTVSLGRRSPLLSGVAYLAGAVTALKWRSLVPLVAREGMRAVTWLRPGVTVVVRRGEDLVDAVHEATHEVRQRVDQRTDTDPSPDVVITTISYRGSVPGRQSDEYVEIANQGRGTADLSDWLLNAGDRDQTFTFPPGTTLAPGAIVRVYTDEIHPETGGFSFESRRAIWNDDGDLGVLRDSRGSVVSSLAYGEADR